MEEKDFQAFYQVRKSLFFCSESFRMSFDLLNKFISLFSSASRDNLYIIDQIINKHTFFCVTYSSLFVPISLSKSFSIVFFLFEFSSRNWPCLSRALLTDFVVSALLVILIALNFFDIRGFWMILQELRQFSDRFSFIHSLFELKPRSTTDCSWLKQNLSIYTLWKEHQTSFQISMK